MSIESCDVTVQICLDPFLFVDIYYVKIRNKDKERRIDVRRPFYYVIILSNSCISCCQGTRLRSENRRNEMIISTAISLKLFHSPFLALQFLLHFLFSSLNPDCFIVSLRTDCLVPNYAHLF